MAEIERASVAAQAGARGRGTLPAQAQVAAWGAACARADSWAELAFAVLGRRE